MSITITQEKSKFLPITIIIDDERTANLLRFMLYEMLAQNSAINFDGCVSSINSFTDACRARGEIEEIHKELVKICK
jgi:hypothetical protein